MERADRKYLELGALQSLFSGGVGSDFVTLLFERAPSAIAVFDREMRYLAASRRWYRDYELEGREIIGQCHYDIFPDVPQRWKDEHSRCLAGENRLCEEDEFLRSDGKSVWIRWELAPLTGDGGQTAGLIMLTEVITKQVEAEAAKEASEESLQLAEQITHIGSWDWNLATDLITCSPEMCRLIGIEPELHTFPIEELIKRAHPADYAFVVSRVIAAREGNQPSPELETRVIRPDGAVVWLRLLIRVARNRDGKPVHLHGIIQDVTEQRVAQHELALRDRAIETAASSVTIASLDGIYSYANQAFVEMLGLNSAADVIGRTIAAFLPDRSQVSGSTESLRVSGRWTGDVRMRRTDGAEIQVHIYAALVRDEDGTASQVVVSYSDVTERNEALQELSRREAQLRQAQELAKLGPWRYDLATRTYWTPPETRQILGLGDEYQTYGPEDAARHIHPDDTAKVAAVTRQMLRGDLDRAEVQYRYVGPRRGLIHVRVIMSAERDAAGAVTGMSGLVQDITSTIALEEAHRETERAMSALMRNLSGMVYRCDNDERWTLRFVSDACSRVLGYEAEDLIDNKLLSFSDVIDPRDRQRVADGIQQAIGNRRAFQLSYRINTKKGEQRWVLEQGSAIRDADDKVVALEGYVADITAEQRIVEQLQESEARNRAIMDSASVALITADEEGFIESFNPEAERLFGYPVAEVAGQAIAMLMPAFPGRVDGSAQRELTGRRRGGEEFSVDLAVSEMRLGERRVQIVSVRDLTERKKAEARLNQAQKMETVGQLVGGVAHDFNNLLMAMQLNLELANMLVADRPEASECITVALGAVDRGAELTKRLLAFSRQQPLDPRVINVNDLIGNMMKLLHRLLSEDIEARTVLDGRVWAMEVDPGQLEAALLNLVVNARDAMPDGGELRIETGNVMLEPLDGDQHEDIVAGEHVRITVSDTGTGMTPEVLARVFDPFFTTKEVGKGSGLGLSMVYGFVKQSGGHIAIDSAVGRGTRVMLHFRRAHAEPAAPRERGMSAPTVRPGHETILLVEDDADVRQTVERLLKSLGYKVIAAADGPAAVELIVGGLRPDLLLADVVLPKGMSGKAVSEAVAARVPACRILFMSGYTEDAVMHHGRLDEGVVLLSKPFPRELLASKVRELLDG